MFLKCAPKLYHIWGYFLTDSTSDLVLHCANLEIVLRTSTMLHNISISSIDRRSAVHLFFCSKVRNYFEVCRIA
jgi:hypothetical protein